MTKLGYRIVILSVAPLLCVGTSAHAARQVAKSAPVLRLEITPPQLTLDGAGEPAHAFVTAVKPDGSRIDVTDRALLRISAPVAHVEAGGHLSAVRNGRA